MKATCIIFTLITLTTCILSCQKKDSTAPVPVTASPKTTDTTSVSPAVTYPYTDTFTGTYTDIESTQYGGSGAVYAMDSPVSVYVIHPNADQIVIKDSPVGCTSPAINDTFATSPGAYLAGSGFQSGGVNFLFTSAISFTFTWSYIQQVGCVDGYVHNCTYNGAKT